MVSTKKIADLADFIDIMRRHRHHHHIVEVRFNEHHQRSYRLDVGRQQHI